MANGKWHYRVKRYLNSIPEIKVSKKVEVPETILYEIGEYSEHGKPSGKLILELKEFLNNLYKIFKKYFKVTFECDGDCDSFDEECDRGFEPEVIDSVPFTDEEDKSEEITITDEEDKSEE